MKFYQTVTIADNADDEWVYYEGYSLADALRQAEYENSHCIDKHFSTEVREYEIDKAWEDMTDDEQCAAMFGYNIVG